MSDCAADDCYIGLGFGNDNGQIGVQFCTIANMRSSGCVNAMLASHSYGNSVNNLVIDMAAANPSDPVEDAINLLANCVGNTFSNIAARNISAVRSAIRIRSGSTDNNIHFGIIEGINTTGKVAAFDAGAKYNHVRLSRMTNPRVRQNNLSSMVSFADPSDNNSWEYDGYPMMEAMTIADGSVVVANPKTTAFIVDTEGGAATDELTTITTGFALEGRTLTLRTANDARDVTVRNDAGNIVLAGSNCVLGNRRSSLTLMYQAANNKWIEVSRSLNT